MEPAASNRVLPGIMQVLPEHDNNDRQLSKALSKISSLERHETHNAATPTQKWDNETAHNAAVGCNKCASLGCSNTEAPW